MRLQHGSRRNRLRGGTDHHAWYSIVSLNGACGLNDDDALAVLRGQRCHAGSWTLGGPGSPRVSGCR